MAVRAGPGTAWRPSRRSWWVIGAIALVAVAVVAFGIVSEARERGDDPGVRVFSHDGPGLSYGVRDGSGWSCTFSASDFSCQGGLGDAKGIGSTQRGDFDVTGHFERDDGLVVVY